MDHAAISFVLLGAATAACAMAVSKSSISRPLRAFATRHVPLLGDLLECPYCLSHWFAAALVFWVDHRLPHGFLVVWLAVTALATVFVGAMSRLLMMPEAEKQVLRDLLAQAHRHNRNSP